MTKPLTNLERKSKLKLRQTKALDKLIKKHNNLYVYPHFFEEFQNQNSKITIICPDHGPFVLSYNSHLNKSRTCPICNGFIRTTARFIELAQAAHGDKYTYKKTIFKSSSYKVHITCSIHGDFEQYPSHHINMRAGCPACAADAVANHQRLDIGIFKKQCLDAHKGFYSYPNLEETYTSVDNSIAVICPIHGHFTQIAKTHRAGGGCPECVRKRISFINQTNPTGWSYSKWEQAAKQSPRFESFKVYIIKLTKDLYKIGKTYRALDLRLSNLPYQSIKVLRIIEHPTDAKFISEKEKELQTLCRPYKILPEIQFKGMHECFSSIAPIIHYIEA